MRKEIIGKATLYLGDCMEGMKEMSDKAFDLAIVDPPYGIGADIQKESFSPGRNGEGQRHRKQWSKPWDDKIPAAGYWKKLFAVSCNQIVWGGNYMTDFLPVSKCWLSWDKMQEFSGSDFELAWTSFQLASKAFRMTRIEAYSQLNKRNESNVKIHPTQKPVRLYSWLLANYAKPGQTILDTHMGSGSSVIACLDRGHEVTAFEIDPEYFEKACIRIEQSQRQLQLAL